MQIAAIDTSVLVGFSGIGRMDVLQVVFSRLVIVPAVYREVVTQGVGWTEAFAAQEAISKGEFLRPVSLPEGITIPTDDLGLGRGEREVIGIAIKERIPALIDDAKARRFAASLGVGEIVGSLGILAKAKRRDISMR